VYTRTWDEGLAPEIAIEPGVRVVHIDAGPRAEVPKEALPELVPAFAAGVRSHILANDGVDAIHANYWLSGQAGHAIKHELDLPLVCTFHTLDRVKADDSEDSGRAEAEAHIIGCSDAVLASCTVEAEQLVQLYGADASRIEIVAPGVDHAFFSPGHRPQARRALGLPAVGPMLLFVGRIQPLKGLEVAVRALALLDAEPDAFLVVVGGPSGPQGDDEVSRIHGLVDELGLTGRVRFLPPQPHELLSTFYRAADVCLVPSRSESFGLVALEAGACGTPVVAAAVGGLRTLIDHGHTGFLVEGRDPRAFAAFTAEILGSSALAAEMSVSAAARARRYTWSIAAARLRRLYGDLTAKALVECR
jgi:D-inositol-3-phosphate glycosyltransferase